MSAFQKLSVSGFFLMKRLIQARMGTCKWERTAFISSSKEND
jgi:hypothetical protein